MVASGLYFVPTKTAFTIPYLELRYYRLLRAKTSPGQEAAVRMIVHGSAEGMFWRQHSFRDRLLHAVEGYALARRTPNQVVPFNVDFPAMEVVKIKNPLLLFPPEAIVTAVAFDGHFGVHRMLHSSEPRRTVAKKGRPMKQITEHERSCHCKTKDAARQVLPDRAAGWQFALGPKTGKVLGAYEHVINEKNEDKAVLLQHILGMPIVNVDLLVHDDACPFEKFVEAFDSNAFDDIKFFLVDAFHMRNHKCRKNSRTRKEKKRLENARASICETFNSWLRPVNFFLNKFRPRSHKFWAQELGRCSFFQGRCQAYHCS